MNTFFEFIEDIKKSPDQKELDLNYLKKSELPLVLYGTGTYSKYVKKFLEDNNINITYVALDEKYFKEDTIFESKPIHLIDSILEKESLVNIIFAFSENYEKRKQYIDNKKVKKCIFFENLLFKSFNIEFLQNNYSVWENLYNLLYDEISRKTLISYLKGKVTGNAEELRLLNEETVQYFPSFLPITSNEVFVDCGAFDGDTILSFNNVVGEKYKKIYALECDGANAAKLKIKLSNLSNIEIIEKACYSEKRTISFSNNGTMESKIDDSGDITIESEKIDNIVADVKTTFIKMDIEGSELEALKGAKYTIIKDKPKLAISVYHKEEDLLTIPQYILSLNDNYKLYLRHYGDTLYETVLYAIDYD